MGAASFTFSLRGVWEGRPVISRLVLHDAEVSLERQADGLRNWRLRIPAIAGRVGSRCSGSNPIASRCDGCVMTATST